ncbi:Leucine-rich repeat protein kinase family protein [Rhynchospora pubera]|uniref:Leucine-rich repeat protein kinase family protein n=1 Tax=Rhynchospora pubera TaxID=906938 RepID=A0AAV8GZL4_9POAL|nr:Leucine-rich repeat protein kinase family protein [Rhynchospora pubera]
MSQWQNVPSSWNQSTDPCDTLWDGIQCANGRVVNLTLPGMNIKGKLNDSIDLLTELTYLDLSSNMDLGGPLPASIGELKKLTNLALQGCSFNGTIPSEIGNLKNLTILALNSNNFIGSIPSSIGLLLNLDWLDLADNQLTGPLPISSATTPGLDNLTNTKHLIFDSNSFSGPIPDTIGFAQKLQTLDLSNNSFTPSTAPSWFSTLTSLNSPAMENTQLTGQIPGGLFALDQIKQVLLDSNQFNGTLDISSNLGKNLQNVSIRNNNITEANITSSYNGSISLVNNPLCQSAKYSNNLYCQSQQKHLPPYSTSLANSPEIFRPYYFIKRQDQLPGSGSSSSISKAAVAGIAVGGCIILIAIALLTVYGLKQRRKVREAAAIASPFASWGSSGKDNGTAPQLKGIRCFTFEELKKCSGYFSENNEIGEGGYGKVYKGYLTDGVAVAIK